MNAMLMFDKAHINLIVLQVKSIESLQWRSHRHSKIQAIHLLKVYMHTLMNKQCLKSCCHHANVKYKNLNVKIPPKEVIVKCTISNFKLLHNLVQLWTKNAKNKNAKKW